MKKHVTTAVPDLFNGWARLAEAVAAELPVLALDGIWVFSKVRHETREFGTAILSRIDGTRRRIYTARFALTIRGSERGTFTTTIEEVGSGPLSALDELLADVRKRSDDGEPPVPVPVDEWYPGLERPEVGDRTEDMETVHDDADAVVSAVLAEGPADAGAEVDAGAETDGTPQP
jgi:hypothetical protein